MRQKYCGYKTVGKSIFCVHNRFCNRFGNQFDIRFKKLYLVLDFLIDLVIV